LLNHVVELTYAYLAGTVDADGFISVGRKTMRTPRKDGSIPIYYVVKIGLSETSPIIPDLLFATFGGWRGYYEPKNASHKPWHIWQATNRKAEAPLRALLPHLRLKQRQAELALEFSELLALQQRARFKALALSADQELERSKLYEAITKLNVPRNRRVHFTDPGI
jgi:hypothetical protein